MFADGFEQSTILRTAPDGLTHLVHPPVAARKIVDRCRRYVAEIEFRILASTRDRIPQRRCRVIVDPLHGKNFSRRSVPDKDVRVEVVSAGCAVKRLPLLSASFYRPSVRKPKWKWHDLERYRRHGRASIGLSVQSGISLTSGSRRAGGGCVLAQCPIGNAGGEETRCRVGRSHSTSVGIDCRSDSMVATSEAATAEVSDHRDYRDQYTVAKASQANAMPPRARKNANTD